MLANNSICNVAPINHQQLINNQPIIHPSLCMKVLQRHMSVNIPSALQQKVMEKNVGNVLAVTSHLIVAPMHIKRISVLRIKNIYFLAVNLFLCISFSNAVNESAEYIVNEGIDLDDALSECESDKQDVNLRH